MIVGSFYVIYYQLERLNIKTAFEHVEVKDVVISEKIKSTQSTKIAVNA